MASWLLQLLIVVARWSSSLGEVIACHNLYLLGPRPSVGLFSCQFWELGQVSDILSLNRLNKPSIVIRRNNIREASSGPIPDTENQAEKKAFSRLLNGSRKGDEHLLSNLMRTYICASWLTCPE